MPSGNVVLRRKELYIIASADYDFEKRRYDSMVLIPFKGSNCTVHVSRKHPAMMKVYKDKEECHGCDTGFNCCAGCCNFSEVPDPALSIDAVKVIADSVDAYIKKRLEKLFYDI